MEFEKLMIVSHIEYFQFTGNLPMIVTVIVCPSKYLKYYYSKKNYTISNFSICGLKAEACLALLSTRHWLKWKVAA